MWVSCAPGNRNVLSLDDARDLRVRAARIHHCLTSSADVALLKFSRSTRSSSAFGVATFNALIVSAVVPTGANTPNQKSMTMPL